jgi:ribonuclease HI
MILSPRGNGLYSKVSELINPVTGTWDIELLNSLFSVVDVQRILEIPLNNQGFDDFIAWHYNKNGRYSVRSGYHIQWKHTFGARQGQMALPGSSASNPVWKELWRLKIPSKCKIFLWRALHAIIPLKSILVNRHIGTSGQCPICQQAPEDLAHLFFQCETARDLWDSLGIAEVIEQAVIIDRAGSAVLEFILRDQKRQLPGFTSIGLKETIGVACWYLWWIRRRRTHNETTPPLLRCKMLILSIVTNSARASANARPRSIKWCAPCEDKVKVNVDGSYHPDDHAGAVGAVIRDHNGGFLAASSSFISDLSSAEAAEALAMREGLALAHRLGFNKVIMESDSVECVEACTGNEAWWGESSAIFADCVDIRSFIDDVSFKHCPREANEAAHEVARVCFDSKISCNWIDNPPSFLVEKLINDVTVL